ncbi:hypothetical protein, partial [Hoeflea sp.]|uniref:hypothetical protein n=1 Tax=Hoeflea sp. TaxID=1940281 RepID=UPI002AFE18A0
DLCLRRAALYPAELRVHPKPLAMVAEGAAKRGVKGLLADPARRINVEMTCLPPVFRRSLNGPWRVPSGVFRTADVLIAFPADAIG